ncbi:MAG: YcgN family cysteine cluster protein [Mangrovicoccus sp.]|nr:YcgN family cysteine cluster protein [Mangrovicoccus sp.]
MPVAELRPRFWERHRLSDLTHGEWEALCDGCGRCCLNKLEDEDSGALAFTRVSCRLLDGESCRCSNYPDRKRYVPECVVLTPANLAQHAYWMPSNCAYRLLYEGHELPQWHPLITGRADSTHEAGFSVQGWCVSEASLSEEDWEDYIIEDL